MLGTNRSTNVYVDVDEDHDDDDDDADDDDEVTDVWWTRAIALISGRGSLQFNVFQLSDSSLVQSVTVSSSLQFNCISAQ